MGMLATNLTLTQAWFPPFAIAWNAPAWALSAFAFFYMVFPFFARRIANWNRKSLQVLMFGLVAASVLPATAYFLADPEGNAWTAVPITQGGFWLNVLRFDPLVWLPQFLSGIVMGRLIGLEVDRSEKPIKKKSTPTVSRGDVLSVTLSLFLAFVPDFPYVLLRHGILVPMITLVILADLPGAEAGSRRVLSWPGFEHVLGGELRAVRAANASGSMVCDRRDSAPPGARRSSSWA